MRENIIVKALSLFSCNFKSLEKQFPALLGFESRVNNKKYEKQFLR